MTQRSLVLVTTSFPIDLDGREAAGSFVADLAEMLSRTRPVCVVAPGRKETVERWSNRLSVYRYAAPEKPLSTLKAWNPVDLYHTIKTIFSGRKATILAARAEPCGHILALWVLPSGYWARVAAKKTGAAYSVWALGSDIWNLGRVPVLRWMIRKVMKQASHRFADGIGLAKEASRLSHTTVDFLPSARLIAEARGRPLKKHPPYRLLYIGRWHSNKGTDILIDALKLLPNGDWALIECVEIHGGGPLEDVVTSGVAQLKKAGRPIIVGGYLDKEESIAAYARSDYLLIPSRVESIPLVFSDAVKLSCPVVSMPVGDLPDLVSAGTGILANDISSSAFAAAIQTALAQCPAEFDQALASMQQRFSVEEGIAARINKLSETQTHEGF